MTTSPLLPPVLTRLIRFSEGDSVKTAFGDGTFRCKTKQATGRPVYVVDLKHGGVLFSQSFWMMPRLPKLSGNEIPCGVGVELLSGRSGSVQSYCVADMTYQVQFDDGTMEKIPSTEIRLACHTRCRTLFGLGSIVNYRASNDSYTVLLDSNATAYLQARDVVAVDLRLLDKIPKPLSVDQVMAEFHGRLSRKQAEALSAAGENAYLTMRSYCEKNTSTLTSISTTLNYGKEYSEVLASLVNPEVQDAAKRVRKAGEKELEKLSELSDMVKKRIEDKLTSNADLAELTQHSKKILQTVGNSIEIRRVAEELSKQLQASAKSEDGRALIENFKVLLQDRVEQQKTRLSLLEPGKLVNDLELALSPQALQNKANSLVQRVAGDDAALACIDPVELLAQVEDYLPNVSKKAAVLLEDSEGFLARIQQSKQGKKILEKAKQLAQVSDDPDSIKDKVTSAVSQVKVEELAKWGRNITGDKAARQAFVDKVKDHCLDFLMSVLPTIEIDPIVGTKDEIDYSISVLDLSNFNVKKEKVSVKLGTALDDEILTMRATSISSLIPGLQWTFAQKYFPYLNGGGSADASVNGGCITLGFRAEKLMVDDEWKPTLAVSSIEIEIKEELKLTINGSWFSAVYNLLATLFKELIRDYIASTLEASLIDHVVTLVTALNKYMKDYWPLLLQILNVTVNQLPTASAWRGAKELSPAMPNEDDITFNVKELPIVVNKRARNRLAYVTSVTMPPNAPEEDRYELAKIPLNTTIVGVNGYSVAKLTANEVRAILKTLSPPMTLRFATDSLDDEIAAVKPKRKLRSFEVEFVEGPFGLKLRARPLASMGVIVAGFIPDRTKMTNPLPPMGAGEQSGQIRPGNLLLRANDIDCRDKSFTQVMGIIKNVGRPATLTFCTSPDGIINLTEWPPLLELDVKEVDGNSFVVVTGFQRLPSFARNSKLINEEDIIVAINGKSVVKMGYDKVMVLLKQAMDTPPYNVSFMKKNDSAKKATIVTFPHVPLGILFGSDRDGNVFVKKFIPELGPAERSGLVYKGCAVLQICGKTISGTNVEEVQELITTAIPPYTLTVRDLEMESNLCLL
ncbi:hypothetical protein THRCLA_03073 [Thraustotheca clavata]|uniref:PDZ domain-containing protein n=1 Tax=Thraustotheca clavata TaxID=74557 RepID=A0A1W0A390_9STRA|nr:hypothetical protein THRCLA_03073 [Thraustotheca clavata]